MDRTDIVSHARALAEAPAGIARKPPKGQKPMVVPASAPRDPVAAALLLKQRTGASGGQGKGKLYQRPKGKDKKWDKDEAAPAAQKKEGAPFRRLPPVQEGQGLTFVATLADGTRIPHRSQVTEGQLTRPTLADMGARAKRRFPTAERIEALAGDEVVMEMAINYIGSFRRPPPAGPPLAAQQYAKPKP
jgi:hypothetical protein